jgi:outer membrane protein OmpA-like peptidoglycan-associated protein
MPCSPTSTATWLRLPSLIIRPMMMGPESAYRRDTKGLTRMQKGTWTVSNCMTTNRFRILCAICAGLACSAVSAEPLDSLPSNWPEAALEARLESAEPVKTGTELHLILKSAKDANLVFLLINDETGRAKLYVPSGEPYGDRIVPPDEARIPDSSTDTKLTADLPGHAHIWVVASSDQLLKPPAVADWVPEEALTAQVRTAIVSHPGIQVAIRDVAFDVEGNSSTPPIVSANDFVHSFDQTRDVHCYQKDFPIQFEFNSAQLSPWGRRQLDQISAGMQADALSRDKFQIEGHTDDVGSDDYNLNLSRERAASVSKYLIGSGVSQPRLQDSGVGKKNPAVPGTSEAARAANRRVAIRRLDNKC